MKKIILLKKLKKLEKIEIENRFDNLEKMKNRERFYQIDLSLKKEKIEKKYDFDKIYYSKILERSYSDKEIIKIIENRRFLESYDFDYLRENHIEIYKNLKNLKII